MQRTSLILVLISYNSYGYRPLLLKKKKASAGKFPFYALSKGLTCFRGREKRAKSGTITLVVREGQIGPLSLFMALAGRFDRGGGDGPVGFGFLRLMSRREGGGPGTG